MCCIISLLQHYYYALTKYPPHYIRGPANVRAILFCGILGADASSTKTVVEVLIDTQMKMAPKTGMHLYKMEK